MINILTTLAYLVLGIILMLISILIIVASIQPPYGEEDEDESWLG